MSIEVMKLALDALEHHGGHLPWNAFVEVRKDLRTAIQQAEAKTDEPVPTIDIDLLAWESIKKAAVESPWIPPQYYQNDWVSDVCSFLREPAPGVPEFSRIAKRKLDELQEQGFAITGYAIQRGTERGFITDGGFVGWWRSNEAPGVQGVPDGYALVRGLVEHIERNTCTHEETHRGGAIWEVCDSCGERWADDEGGRPTFKWPPIVEKARAELAATQAQKGGAA